MTKVTSFQINCPYKFSVYLTSAQTPPGSTFTKVVLNVKEFDTGSNFDNVTNFRFTAPVAGFYQFNGHIDGGGTRTIASLFKNGTEYKRGSDVSASSGGSSVSSLIQLAATEYVELFGFVSTGAFGASGTMDCYLNGYMVSQT